MAFTRWEPLYEKVILVFDGEAGAGKTTSIDVLFDRYGIPAIPKHSDRAPRVLPRFSPGESICLSEDAFTKWTFEPDVFWYRYHDRRYGVSLRDIEARLQHSPVATMVSNSHDFTNNIQKALQNHVKVVWLYVQVDTPEKVIYDRLIAEGTPEKEVLARMYRPRPAGDSFQTRPDKYAHVIDNSKGRDYLEAQLHDIASQYVGVDVPMGLA